MWACEGFAQSSSTQRRFLEDELAGEVILQDSLESELDSVLEWLSDVKDLDELMPLPLLSSPTSTHSPAPSAPPTCLASPRASAHQFSLPVVLPRSDSPPQPQPALQLRTPPSSAAGARCARARVPAAAAAPPLSPAEPAQRQPKVEWQRQLRVMQLISLREAQLAAEAAEGGQALTLPLPQAPRQARPRSEHQLAGSGPAAESASPFSYVQVEVVPMTSSGAVLRGAARSSGWSRGSGSGSLMRAASGGQLQLTPRGRSASGCMPLHTALSGAGSCSLPPPQTAASCGLAALPSPLLKRCTSVPPAGGAPMAKRSRTQPTLGERQRLLAVESENASLKHEVEWLRSALMVCAGTPEGRGAAPVAAASEKQRRPLLLRPTGVALPFAQPATPVLKPAGWQQ